MVILDFVNSALTHNSPCWPRISRTVWWYTTLPSTTLQSTYVLKTLGWGTNIFMVLPLKVNLTVFCVLLHCFHNAASNQTVSFSFYLVGNSVWITFPYYCSSQTCNKSSNSQVQVQVQVHYPQVQVQDQVDLKWASPSPSPSPLPKGQVQVQVQVQYGIGKTYLQAFL